MEVSRREALRRMGVVGAGFALAGSGLLAPGEARAEEFEPDGGEGPIGGGENPIRFEVADDEGGRAVRVIDDAEGSVEEWHYNHDGLADRVPLAGGGQATMVYDGYRLQRVLDASGQTRQKMIYEGDRLVGIRAASGVVAAVQMLSRQDGWNDVTFTVPGQEPVSAQFAAQRGFIGGELGNTSILTLVAGGAGFIGGGKILLGAIGAIAAATAPAWGAFAVGLLGIALMAGGTLLLVDFLMDYTAYREERLRRMHDLQMSDVPVPLHSAEPA